VGPYTFREDHHKVNITFNADATVDFYQVMTELLRKVLLMVVEN
jgi:hypothetical protein